MLTKIYKISLWTIAVPALLWTGYASTMFLSGYFIVLGSRRYAKSPINPIGVYGPEKYYLLIVFGLLFTACFVFTLVSLLKKNRKFLLYSIFATIILTFLTFIIVQSD